MYYDIDRKLEHYSCVISRKFSLELWRVIFLSSLLTSKSRKHYRNHIEISDASMRERITMVTWPIIQRIRNRNDGVERCVGSIFRGSLFDYYGGELCLHKLGGGALLFTQIFFISHRRWGSFVDHTVPYLTLPPTHGTKNRIFRLQC